MKQSDQPLVSIIVPCYNQAEYLPETLDSIIAQTYQNWEAVVMSDGSPDDTARVANEYAARDARIKFAEQVNQGVSSARNNAIRNYSSGEYILPLDADDLIMPYFLEHALAYFNAHPECKLVYGQTKRFGSEIGKWELPEYSFRKLLFNNMIPNTAMYRRTDYNNTIGYNDNMRNGVEDWDFWLTLLKPNDVVFRLDEILYLYRIKPQSRNTIAIQDDIMIPLRRIIYNNHKEYYQDYVQDIITYVRKNNATQYYIDRINNSLSMKIGRIFTTPIGKIRDCIKGIIHK